VNSKDKEVAVTCIGWLAVASVVVAFWAMPIAATLALFPKVPRSRRHRGGTPDD
jgi:hypothetical protein